MLFTVSAFDLLQLSREVRILKSVDHPNIGDDLSLFSYYCINSVWPSVWLDSTTPHPRTYGCGSPGSFWIPCARTWLPPQYDYSGGPLNASSAVLWIFSLVDVVNGCHLEMFEPFLCLRCLLGLGLSFACYSSVHLRAMPAGMGSIDLSRIERCETFELRPS